MALDINGRMGIADAASELAAKKDSSIEAARQRLVFALMCGDTVALCGALWTDAIVTGRQPLRSSSVHEGRVPADFWRREHARDCPDSWTPTGGSWGNWSRGGFRTVIPLTCDAARQRFPELLGSFSAGSDIVEITWTATDVTLHAIDVERLKARTDWRNIKDRAERANPVPQGRKSDQVAIYAAFAASLTPADRLTDFIADPSLTMRSIDLILAQASADQHISAKSLEGFAQLFREAIWERLGRAGPPIDGN